MCSGDKLRSAGGGNHLGHFSQGLLLLLGSKSLKSLKDPVIVWIQDYLSPWGTWMANLTLKITLIVWIWNCNGQTVNQSAEITPYSPSQIGAQLKLISLNHSTANGRNTMLLYVYCRHEKVLELVHQYFTPLTRTIAWISRMRPDADVKFMHYIDQIKYILDS